MAARPRLLISETSPLRIVKSKNALVVGNALFQCAFSPGCGGLPARIGLTGDAAPLLRTDAPIMRARIGKRGIRPFLSSLEPRIAQQDGVVRVWFDDIPWCDEAGTALDGFRLSLEYEFHADGAVFVTTFFYTDTVNPGKISDFVLEPVVQLTPEQDANWSYWRLPPPGTREDINIWAGSMLERNLSRRESRKMPKTIVPFVSFDMGIGGRRDRHIEFFVESWNALNMDPLNTETEVSWRGRQTTVTWNFQSRPEHVAGRPCQWNNTWGWCLRRYPARRRPPMRIVHYIDNFHRYPDDKVIRQIAAEGANVLILHENWRLDLKGDATPYDPKRLRAVLNLCHKHGLRVALYVRGREHCIAEQFAEPLRTWLKKDFDGIYMDGGSPRGYQSKGADAPGGRIHFRESHRMTREIRKFVGEGGIFFSHAGASFAAIGQTTVDAYLGGEQEKGMLIKDPTTHAYYSGISVAPSSLWTCAFPTYRTPRMVPFLASTLQMPYLHLGTQFPYSSLSHPRTPSLVTFARPLWRLWELFDEGKMIEAYSTQSEAELLQTDSRNTGASLMVNERGDMLLTAANFAAKARKVRVKLDLSRIGARFGKNAWRLTSAYTGQTVEPTTPAGAFEAIVEGYGVAGWLITDHPAAWKKPLARFQRPYPTAPKEEAAWAASLKRIRDLRFNPPAWKQCFLRVSVPNWPNSYEDPVWFDLFENTVELHDVTQRDRPVRLGILSQKGLGDKTPGKDDLIWPGKATPWIPLHSLPLATLQNGLTQLELASRRAGGEFYSLVKVELSPVAARVKETYEAVYNNDIDLDWSRLRFAVQLRTT